MKILLFEGLDNIGKSTIARMFAEKYAQKYTILFVHSRYPSSLSPDPFKYQYDEFMYKAKLLRECYEYELDSNHPLEEMLVIMDRSWLDEYVYGQIYRNENPYDIKSMIDDCFKVLAEPGIKICTIHLISSIWLSIKNDDNKSFTSSMLEEEKINNVKTEYSLFDAIVHYYSNNNICPCIDINVEAETENKKDPIFRSKEGIFEDIIKQLENKNILL